MRFTSWFGACLACALAFNACAGDEQKKVVRADGGAAGDGGEAGDHLASAGDSSGGKGGTRAPIGGAGDAGGDASLPAAGSGATANTAGSPSGAGGQASGEPITISGLVVANNEHPLSGVTIQVQGQSVVTGADGVFELDVLAPYDLVVRSDLTTETHAYLGLTRADPKLYFLGTGGRFTSLQGVVTGGAGFPQPANHQTQLTLRGGVLATFDLSLPASSDGNYSSTNVPWVEEPSVTTTLFGLQFDAVSNVITGMASKEVTLTDQEPLVSPEADLDLSAVTLRDFTVNLSGPSGVTFGYCTVNIGQYGITITSPGSTVTAQVPNGVPDVVGLSVFASGETADGYLYTTLRAPGDATSVDLDFAEPPTLTTPDDRGAAGDDTVLGFERRPGTLSVIVIGYTEYLDGESSIEHATTVYTNESNVSLKRLRDLQLDLDADATSTWGVTTLADVSNVDAYTAPEHELSAGHVRSYSLERDFGPAPDIEP